MPEFDARPYQVMCRDCAEKPCQDCLLATIDNMGAEMMRLQRKLESAEYTAKYYFRKSQVPCLTPATVEGHDPDRGGAFVDVYPCTHVLGPDELCDACKAMSRDVDDGVIDKVAANLQVTREVAEALCRIEVGPPDGQ